MENKKEKPTLKEKQLIQVIENLLLRPIGKKIKTLDGISDKSPLCLLGDKLINFSSKESDIAALYFGLNEDTNRLHWLLLNDGYQHTKQPINNEVVNKKIKKEKILEQVFRGIPDIYDPSNYAEVPAKPQRKDRGEVGLVMKAYKNKKPYYSPFAILDNRSLDPGIFDCNLGCETAFYLPIIKNDAPLGVLLVFFEATNNDGNGYEIKMKNDVVTNFKDFKKESRQVENSLKHVWSNILNDTAVQQNIDILNSLFHAHLETYMDYVHSFDHAVMRRFLDVVNGITFLKTKLDLGKDRRCSLHKLTGLEMKALDYLERFFTENKGRFPMVDYLETLRELEPLLQTMGKKDHYLHMFNTFAFGCILIDQWIPNGKKGLFIQVWALIAFSHDIGYPIELIEKEIGEFFERYFHKKKIPNLLVSKELLWSYGNFLRYRQMLEMGLDGMFSNTNKEIFLDMMDLAFHERTDHAVLSTLFTMKCIDMHWTNSLKLKNEYKGVINKGIEQKSKLRKEQFLQLVGIPVLLHNIYQWKYFYKQGLEKTMNGVKDWTEDINGNGCKLKLKDGKLDGLLAHLWDRRHYQALPQSKIKNDIDDYNKKLQKLCIPKINFRSIGTYEEILRFFSFLLAFTDFFQETSREHHGKGGHKVPTGLYVSGIENNGVAFKLRLRTPFVMKIKPPDAVGDDKGNIYTEEELKWKKRTSEFLNIEDNEKGQIKLKSDIAKKWEEAKKGMKAWLEKGDGTVHPYAAYLQAVAAQKAFEFEKKFKDVFSTRQGLTVLWENLFSVRKNGKNKDNKFFQLDLKS